MKFPIDRPDGVQCAAKVTDPGTLPVMLHLSGQPQEMTRGPRVTLLAHEGNRLQPSSPREK